MLTFKPTIQKNIERIVKRYPVESGQCSRCAKQIYNLLMAEGFHAQIGRMETDFRFLVTHDGIRLSHRVGNSLAYHEFVRVGDYVINGMTGAMGMEWSNYQKLFYEGVFEDGTIRVAYSTP